jgi:hypothetical protein
MKSIRNVPAARAGDAGDNAVASRIAQAATIGRNSWLSVRTDDNDEDDDSEGDRSHFSLSAAAPSGRVDAEFSGLRSAAVGRIPTKFP